MIAAPARLIGVMRLHPFARRSSARETPARRRVPPGFEAVAEALVLGEDPLPACQLTGKRLAEGGASVAEALDGLAGTYRLLTGGAAPLEASRALVTCWVEATLSCLQAQSCADPVTGLATLAHVRTRLHDLYREAAAGGVGPAATHALVVVELVGPVDFPDLPGQLSMSLRLAEVAQSLRALYPGGETLGRLGGRRAVAVVPRGPDLGARIASLRGLVAQWRAGGDTAPPPRVWVEGLPHSGSGADQLLDDLAR